jgi:multidrug resistance efflux pump
MPGEIFDGRVRSIGIGIAAGQSHPPGTLPTIQNNRDFLRQAQRFPVIIDFAIANPELGGQLRIGGQASVTVYSRNAGLVAFLARFHIRLMSWLSYAY